MGIGSKQAALGHTTTPEFLENNRQDAELVFSAFYSARAADVPIDEDFIKGLAEARLDQATEYSFSADAPGASLESSTNIVKSILGICQLFEEYDQDLGQ